MIIAIDGNEANVERKVGISEYAFELLLQFKKFQIPNIHFQIYLKEKPRKDMPSESNNWQYRVIGPKKMWTQIGLPLDLFLHKPKPDIFFSPSHYAPRFSPIKTAISVMDLSYIHFPSLFKKSDLYQLKNWTAYSIGNASLVFTISNSSKNDIIKEYGIAPGRVVVTYPGIKKVSSMDNTKKKHGIKGEYVLFVGTLQPRKNIRRLVEAFSKLKNKENLQLVVVGKKGWQYEEILSAPKKFNVLENVLFLEFVSDDDLASLYKHALFFILPSLYEGFGLPVLEAMQYGCPVITSNVSSLPEAGGDAALYVNPDDVLDIKAKMETLISDGNLRAKMSEKGYEQVKKFSWEKTAKQTLDALRTIA